MGTEVITTTDKDQRDRMFDDLRKNGNRLERQVVKFSGVEMVEPPTIDNTVDPPIETRAKFRSTYSISYPTGKAN